MESKYKLMYGIEKIINNKILRKLLCKKVNKNKERKLILCRNMVRNYKKKITVNN